MNDFREFQKQYNNYLRHGLSTGSGVKYGSKEYAKSGRRVYGTEAANMRPKDYLARCLREGMSTNEIVALCESAMDPRYGIGPAEKRFYSEVIRLAKNDIQHSYNDFYELHEDYLMHFGILGMKWGVRRYQNPDGSLTNEGKERYNNDEKFRNKMNKDSKYRKHVADEKTKKYEANKAIAEKHGFQSDDDMNGNFTNKTKDIVIDKDTPLDDNFMKQVDDFNKNYKDHDKIMRDAATKQMAERLGISENEMKKIIDKNDRPWIYMSDNTNSGLSMTADYDLFDGNHVATVEYDPKTKKVYYVSMNG